jgi:hypothetical protein
VGIEVEFSEVSRFWRETGSDQSAGDDKARVRDVNKKFYRYQRNGLLYSGIGCVI